jgi:hypothetical protein
VALWSVKDRGNGFVETNGVLNKRGEKHLNFDDVKWAHCSFSLHGMADPQFFYAIPKGTGGEPKYTCSPIYALDLPAGIFKGVENLRSFHFSQSFFQFGPGSYFGGDDKIVGQLQY